MALRWAHESVSAGSAGVIGCIVGIGIFAIAAIGFAALALQPAIEIHETCLVMTGVWGRRAIPWEQIRRVEQSRWQTRWQARWSVLSVVLTLDGGRRLWVVYAGGFDSSRSLLRHLRLSAREALLDGIPYRQFWGEGAPEQRRPEYSRSEQGWSERGRPTSANAELMNAGRAPLGSGLGDQPFRYPMLLAEDEAEIERMFQRLKSAGRLDTQGHDTRDTRGDASLDSRASGEGQG
jgi:hypothetical protein